MFGGLKLEISGFGARGVPLVWEALKHKPNKMAISC